MIADRVDLVRDDHDEQLLLAEVAQRYYIEDQTQEQIARSIGVSRSNVSRMLKEARRLGLVEIRIHHPLATDAELRSSIMEAFHLTDCLVLAQSDSPGESSPAAVLGRVGDLAARYLDEHLDDSAVVGVGWGSTVYHVVISKHLRKRSSATVVQLMGSVGGATPDVDGAQVAGRLGRTLGARVYYLHAPMVVTDPAVRAGLMRDQHIRKTLEMAKRSSVLLVSVGAISEASGLYRAGYLNDADLEFIKDQGAAGDICGSYYRLDGTPCSLELEERTVAVPATVMREIPLRIGVGCGTSKALPSVGAVRAGLVDVLIIDDSCAREMLRIAAATRD